MNKKGFTLIELLMASTILLIVLTVVFSVYAMLSQYVSDTSLRAIMQGRVRLALEKMARNARLATNISCPPEGNSLLLTFDPSRMDATGNPWTSQYRLNNNQILYSPDISSSREIVILDKVELGASDKLFQYDDGKKLVTIDVRAENTTVTSEQSARLITVVKARNAD